MSRTNAVIAAGPDDRSLDFFFASERLFYRSTMGAQLERAAAQRGRADEQRLQPKVVWWWRPNGEPPPIYVSSSRGEGGGYELEHGDMMHSRLSRRMRVLCQRSSGAYAVLSVYYGDRGARWARSSQDRYEKAEGDEEEKLVARGLGYGAIVALYPLTAAGQELLRRERSKSVVRATERKAARELHRRRAEEHTSRVAALDHAIAKAERDSIEAMQKLEEALRAREAARKLFAATRAEVGRGGRGEHPARDAVQAATRRAERASEEHEAAERALSLLRQHRAHAAAPTTLPSPIPTSEARAAHAEIAALLAEHARACEVAKVAGSEPPPLPDLPDVPAAHTPVVVPPVTALAQLSDDEILEVAFLLQRTTPAEGRRLLLARAHEQAEELLRTAIAEWKLTQEPKKRHA